MAAPAIIGIISAILGTKDNSQPVTVSQPQGYGQQRQQRQRPSYTKSAQQQGITNALGGIGSNVQPGQVRTLNPQIGQYMNQPQGQSDGQGARNVLGTIGQVMNTVGNRQQPQSAYQMPYLKRR